MFSMKRFGSSAHHGGPRNNESVAAAPGNVGADSDDGRFRLVIQFTNLHRPHYRPELRSNRGESSPPGRHRRQEGGIMAQTPVFWGRTWISGREPAKIRQQPVESTMKTPILIMISAFLMAGCTGNHERRQHAMQRPLQTRWSPAFREVSRILCKCRSPIRSQ